MASASSDRGMTADMLKAAFESKQVPTALEPYIKQLGPLIVAAANILDAAWPVVEKCFAIGMKGWKTISPYKHDFLPIVFGLMLIFFGGSLPLTIAAIEAFRLCGWEKTKASALTLAQQFRVAMDASKKDDLIDADNDGVADVKQIGRRDLITRKIQVFMKVADPVKLNEGMSGVMVGVSAVVAVLQTKFAASVALGISLGDIFTNAAEKMLRPTLEHVIPKEDHKWIPMALSYGCRATAVTIAWWLQRVISALHCAMRGSDMLMQGLFALAASRKIAIPLNLGPSHAAYPMIIWALSAFGFYYQVSKFFGLPFPFNILLIPLRVVEYALAWMVYSTK